MATPPRSPQSPVNSPSMQTTPTSPTFLLPESTEDVHEKLRSLHCDELVQISPPTILGTFYSWVKGYVKFLWMIWGQVFKLGLDECTDSFEWTLIFAIMTTTLLVPMLFFCMFFSLPGIQPLAFRLYAYAVTTPMYEAWWNGDKRALAASRAALCKSVESRNSRFGPGNNNRNFDLDIARILLQFAGLVYEHDSSGIRKALAIVKNATPFDVFGTLRGRGRVGLDKFIGADPAALARAALTGERLVRRPTFLGKDGPLVESPLAAKPGTRLEPQVESTKPAPHGNTNAHVEPGPGDSTIRAHLQSSGIEYEPVSELNGVGSAFAALFWHPKEPWIVVAFKGTSPTEFDEWVTDLTFTRENIGHWIPGFGKVHSGFKARMFPDEARIPHSLRDHFKRHMNQLRDWWIGEKSAKQELPIRTPYDTIRDGIQIVADHLTRNTGIHSINVYFTGHSLGCATASLAYSRAVAKQNSDFKSNVRIRDAYMFAAPIIGDVMTRDAFNSMMGSGLPKSMWRVSNGPDAVAGLLPEMGDRVPLKVDQESPLAFAHLGLEIKMIPTGPDGRGRARVDAVVAPHRPTHEPVYIVQRGQFGPEEEEHGRTTNDRDSGVFTESMSEQSYDGRIRIADSGTFKLAIVKQIPLLGPVLWWGVSHIIFDKFRLEPGLAIVPQMTISIGIIRRSNGPGTVFDIPVDGRSNGRICLLAGPATVRRAGRV
ncbi:Alpha beta-hydrolase [Rhizoctonia solani]|uniref:Alpha beta-hydrolase n=1 Tax=Rhizoctonia solani TaxID=456999 RepID=A0A8H7HCV4_9AGAM|nr:Alpha beta-hydrolase [Rhizoctonia solani]